MRADTPWLRLALALLPIALRPAAAHADEVAFAAVLIHVSNGDYLFHDGKPNDGENFLVAQLGVAF